MAHKDGSSDTARCCARHDDRNTSNYRVVVGEFDRFEPDPNEQPFNVRQLVVHENYVGRNTFWDCDIALLELDGRCPVTACSMPVCLPPAADDDDEGEDEDDSDGDGSNGDSDDDSGDESGDDHVPYKCYATGWGRDIGILRQTISATACSEWGSTFLSSLPSLPVLSPFFPSLLFSSHPFLSPFLTPLRSIGSLKCSYGV